VGYEVLPVVSLHDNPQPEVSMSLDCNDYDSPERGEEDPATDWAIRDPQGYMAARALVAAINNGSTPKSTQEEVDQALQVVDMVDEGDFFSAHPELRDETPTRMVF
jgi:hypothetical protein